MRTLEYYRTRSAIDRVEMLTALVKRFHVPALEVANERLTPRELQLIANWNVAMRQPSSFEISRATAISSTPRPKMKQRRFASLARKQLEPMLGKPEVGSKTTSRYRVSLDGWTISTWVNYGSPPYLLHHIRFADGRSLRENISLLAWLGISGQTTWELAEDGDEPDVASAIGDICTHFLTAVPKLLADLSAHATAPVR